MNTVAIAVISILLGVASITEKRDRDSCNEPTVLEGEVSKPERVSIPAIGLKAADLEGVDLRSVWLEAVINCEGRVVNPSIQAELPDRLERIILKAVRRWRFKPARTEDGERVAVVFRLAVNLVAG
jgi:hypothetical protein